MAAKYMRIRVAEYHRLKRLSATLAAIRDFSDDHNDAMQMAHDALEEIERKIINDRHLQPVVRRAISKLPYPYRS